MLNKISKVAYLFAYLSAFFLLICASAIFIFLLTKASSGLINSNFWTLTIAPFAGSLMLSILTFSFALPLALIINVSCTFYLTPIWKKYFAFINSILAALPSIIIGMWGLLLLECFNLIGFRSRPSILLSAICLSILILPYLCKGIQNMIDTFPTSIQEQGLVLGFNKSQQFLYLFLPSIKKKAFMLISLTFARIFEDTAVVMLTGAAYAVGIAKNFTDPFESMSFQIFYLLGEARTEAQLEQLFATAFMLLAVLITLNTLMKGYKDARHNNSSSF